VLRIIANDCFWQAHLEVPPSLIATADEVIEWR